MATSTGTRPVLRFGPFEFDAATGELFRNGQRVPLQDKPGQVLAALLEHPGAIATREELRLALWETDTFVDFEHGLNTAIKKVRKALGDSAESPAFIETLARRGYRFIAPVTPVTALASARTPAPAGADARVAGKRALQWGLLMFLAAAAFAGIWIARGRPGPAS